MFKIFCAICLGEGFLEVCAGNLCPPSKEWRNLLRFPKEKLDSRALFGW